MTRALLLCLALFLASACDSEPIVCIEPAFGPTTLVVVDGAGKLGVTRDIDTIRELEGRVVCGPQPSEKAYRILVSDGRQVHTRLSFDLTAESALKTKIDGLVRLTDDAALIGLADSGDPELARLARRAMERRRAKPPATAAPSKP